jgi:hypothetical protein
MGETCFHIKAITNVKRPMHRVCPECEKIDSYWVHLRICQTCEATLCCDSSPNKHASAHAHASGHPVIASAEPNEVGSIATRTIHLCNTDLQWTLAHGEGVFTSSLGFVCEEQAQR